MQYCIYILLSSKDHRTYIGHTDNLNRRLYEHSVGQVEATKHRRPLQLLYAEKCSDIIEAKRREEYWKSGGGRRKLKSYFKNGFPPIKDGRGSPK